MNSSAAALRIRRATAEDAALLLAWRNDLQTQRQSRVNEPVTPETHARWIESSLKDIKRRLCIAETQDGEPVGTVRADLRDDGYTKISYTMAPAWRGKGLATPMVAQFVKEFLQGEKLAAQIKKGHAPSEAVARALGLSPAHEIPPLNPSDPRPMVEWR